MFNNIYKGRNIAITGHTGFKGSWLVSWLNKLDANVFGYSLDPPSTPNHFDLLDLEMASDIRCDIRDLESLQKFYEIAKPEIVFHLAAQSLVRPSYDSPADTFSTNVQGTVNVLESARNSGFVRAVVVVTSDKCYENLETEHRYKETDKLGGYDPYSASKACAELVASCYQKSFLCESELQIVSVRAGNVIGGGDWAIDRLIPDVARKYQSSSILNVRQPKAVRPWQHVLEPISGYLLLGQMLMEKKRDYIGSWNFGPLKGEVHTVEDILASLSSHWDFQYSLSEDYKGLHEAGLLMLDCGKAESQLGWFPVWGHEEAIKKTAEWYNEFINNDSLLTSIQLEEYLESAKQRKAIWAI